ncbi:hypothetical protein BdWA1_001010 [Babesia duncani]|uniref:Uncharacterized protein n=1 Tax=Babesia duncani TaxID=323732 RepID=A0AAD9PN86_9APIC|nr:hypothetical protein BdWA1_001010 [Babesia duncani]
MSSSGHQDAYFQYTLSQNDISGHYYQIDKFTFNNEEHKFECDKTFMYGILAKVIVYACKDGSNNFHPWLLHLHAYYYGSSSTYTCLNYFFMPKGDGEGGYVWKNHKFTRLTAISEKSGSIVGNEYEGVTNYLKSYFTDLKDSGAIGAWVYRYKKSSNDGNYSYIQPNKLASYLGQSDKRHQYSSDTKKNSVSSFLSYSDSNPSFEITFTGRQKRSGGTIHEKTVTFKSSTGDTSNLTKAGETTKQIVSTSGSGSSCQARTNGQGNGSAPSSGDGKPDSAQVSQEATQESVDGGSEEVEDSPEIGGSDDSSSPSSPESGKQISEKSATQETSMESAEKPSELDSAPSAGEFDNSEPSASSSSTNEGGKAASSTGNTQESQGGSPTSVVKSDTNSDDSPASPGSEVSAGGDKRKQVEQSDSQDSVDTASVQDSPSSTETEPAGSTGSPEKSQSSSNLPWIVGGTVIGSGGLIGVGVFIYKCIR